MGIFDSKAKKKVLEDRLKDERVVKERPSYFEGWNGLAKTYLDEMKLPETSEQQKKVCLARAVQYYNQAIAVGSLQADPYIFLAKYNRELPTPNPAKALELEKKGLIVMIAESDKRMKNLKKDMISRASQDPSKAAEEREKLKKDELLMADQNAATVFLCEDYTKRTNNDTFRKALITLLGGEERYQHAYTLAEMSGYSF